MPLAAIAAACHLSHRFCIFPSGQDLRCFAPGETVLHYREVYPPHLGLYFGAAGKPLRVVVLVVGCAPTLAEHVRAMVPSFFPRSARISGPEFAGIRPIWADCNPPWV